MNRLLTARVHKIRNSVYMATDFSEFGSSGAYIKPAREKSRSPTKILSPLKPSTFQPLEYNLCGGGAAAMLELNQFWRLCRNREGGGAGGTLASPSPRPLFKWLKNILFHFT